MQAIRATMVQWIWRQIGVKLPATWEMLQFSTEYPQGRCAFADRYQFRFELTWTMVKGEPDYNRMVSDYLSKLEREKRLVDGQEVRKAGWHGFHGIMQGDRTSRFGRYLEPLGCLVECVFLWPDDRDEALESEILSSIEPMTAGNDGRQRWRAFGLDMKPPATAAIEGCIAQPARARFSYGNPKTGSQWSYERLGLTAYWLKEPVENWLAQHLGSGLRDLRISHVARSNVDVIHAEASFKPSGLHLKRGQLAAEAWICPADGRLYVVTVRRRGNHPLEAVPMDQLFAAAPDFTPRWEP